MKENSVFFRNAQRICNKVDCTPLDGADVFITGASGLIGTSLLACLCFLRQQGMKIKITAQYLSKIPFHIKDIISENEIQMLNLNLGNFDVHKTPLPYSDVIIHSAGYAQPAVFILNQLATIQVNTAATSALLSSLSPNGKFLFISSSEVYSGLKKDRFNEADIGTTNPLHPRACYIEGKRCGEAISNAYRQQGVHSCSARVSMAYGPGTKKNDKRALNMFIQKALCNGKIEMMDTGASVRTYCYISDIVEMLWHILLYGKEPVYNIGGNSTATFAELANYIGRILHVPVVFPDIEHQVSGAPAEVHLDISKYENEFKKKDFIDFQDGLKETIEWQKELYRGNLNE